MMTEQRAAEIQTWLDEPELLREPGQPDPTFSADEVTEARLICATIKAQFATVH